MYRFWFLGNKKLKNNSMCVSDCKEIGLQQKVYCTLCADTAGYGTDTVSSGSSGKKRLPGLCSALPSASSVGVLCCTAIRTVLSVLSHTLYNH